MPFWSLDDALEWLPLLYASVLPLLCVLWALAVPLCSSEPPVVERSPWARRIGRRAMRRALHVVTFNVRAASGKSLGAPDHSSARVVCIALLLVSISLPLAFKYRALILAQLEWAPEWLPLLYVCVAPLLCLGWTLVAPASDGASGSPGSRNTAAWWQFGNYLLVSGKVRTRRTNKPNKHTPTQT